MTTLMSVICHPLHGLKSCGHAVSPRPGSDHLERPAQLSRVGLGESLGRLARDERHEIADLLALNVDDAEALARTHLEGGTGARLHQHLPRDVHHRATPRIRSKVRTNASIAVT